MNPVAIYRLIKIIRTMNSIREEGGGVVDGYNNWYKSTERRFKWIPFWRKKKEIRK